MKRIPTFLAGMLTAAVIGGLGVGALAASGAVTFNASALQLNGQQISAKGENYTLDNGQQVPASITYTDETGGGTTYLPVRRIAELLGIEIGWDSATGSVTVAGDVKSADTPDPDTTTPSTDYSDWSAEEEAAYQEFKGMWEAPVVRDVPVEGGINRIVTLEFIDLNFDGLQDYNDPYNGPKSLEKLKEFLFLNNEATYAERYANELKNEFSADASLIAIQYTNNGFNLAILN
ncbi:stalk domain-containing protein [Pseudoflavonifractor phocaeensis]|uniref:stalk domain-containing protein n=1 Tax=Pseudoflavonifractor phocaeensis TaxID=1870988 RepID=UPI00210DDF17|nr:stalk domain-containing protein [Pseudoflavonifractor phocaeensis]MCQ4864674.1 copper amine oxidase N-terminal domain-containing protein [Pseudoflavonifractor phocaeensis]